MLEAHAGASQGYYETESLNIAQTDPIKKISSMMPYEEGTNYGFALKLLEETRKMTRTERRLKGRKTNFSRSMTMLGTKEATEKYEIYTYCHDVNTPIKPVDLLS